jgi:hypothetical protein
MPVTAGVGALGERDLDAGPGCGWPERGRSTAAGGADRRERHARRRCIMVRFC